MKTTVIGILIAVLVISGLTFIVAKDTIAGLAPSDTYSATIVKCDSKETRTKGRKLSGRMKVTMYAPVAVSKEGYQATGRVWRSSKSRCERMIGSETSISVNRANPDKMRIKSSLPFWVFPAIFLFFIGGVVAILLRQTKLAIGIFVGLLLLVGTSFAIEFRVFQKRPAVEPNLQPIVPELALKACINQAMRNEDVQSARKLKYLTCKKRGLTDLSELGGLTLLEELDLSGNKITSLKRLSSLSKLRTLTLTGNKQLTSLAGLENLQSLESLIVHCAALREIEPVKILNGLRRLDVSCNAFSDLSPIKDLDKLEHLNIDSNRELIDISALANKPRLEVLGMYSTGVTDISPLFKNTKLRSVNIGGKGRVPCGQVNELRSRLSKPAQIRGVKHCDEN